MSAHFIILPQAKVISQHHSKEYCKSSAQLGSLWQDTMPTTALQLLHHVCPVGIMSSNDRASASHMQVVKAKQKRSSHSHPVTAAEHSVTVCSRPAPHSICNIPPCTPCSEHQEVRGYQTALIGDPAGGWLLLLSQLGHRRFELLCLLQCGSLRT